MKIKIYQLKDTEEFVGYHFLSYEQMLDKNITVNSKNYNLVFTEKCYSDKVNLHDIYYRYNMCHPKGFRGHSLSISDVIVIEKENETAVYFVDQFGFKKLQNFF